MPSFAIKGTLNALAQPYLHPIDTIKGANSKAAIFKELIKEGACTIKLASLGAGVIPAVILEFVDVDKFLLVAKGVDELFKVHGAAEHFGNLLYGDSKILVVNVYRIVFKGQSMPDTGENLKEMKSVKALSSPITRPENWLGLGTQTVACALQVYVFVQWMFCPKLSSLTMAQIGKLAAYAASTGCTAFIKTTTVVQYVGTTFGAEHVKNMFTIGWFTCHIIQRCREKIDRNKLVYGDAELQDKRIERNLDILKRLAKIAVMSIAIIGCVVGFSSPVVIAILIVGFTATAISLAHAVHKQAMEKKRLDEYKAIAAAEARRIALANWQFENDLLEVHGA